MKASTLTATAMALLMTSVGAWAQQSPTPPARATPRPDQLEPGVNTSATPPPDAAPTRPAPAVAAPNTSDNAQTSAPAKQPAPKGKGRSAAGADAKGGTDAATPKTGAGSKAQDRIELDTTEITGNRELPKVLYIVPWKRSDLGDLVGKPVNSLLDEVLAPVDRDVFKRENRYYDALKPDQTGPGAGSTPGAAPSVDKGPAPSGGKP